MIKKLLPALVIFGVLGSAARAQTTPPPAGHRQAGTPTTPAGPARKTGQAARGTTGTGNSGDAAPNRSTTAGDPAAATSNNPVDATGKPVGTAQSNNPGPSKPRQPKK